VPLFAIYLAAGNNLDQTGAVYSKALPSQTMTFQIKGTWFDIGSKEATEVFAKFSSDPAASNVRGIEMRLDHRVRGNIQCVRIIPCPALKRPFD
jgi:hypothetical protein